MNAHTPGPWRTGDGSGDPVQSSAVYAINADGTVGNMVCSTTGYFKYPVRAANAELIAASPELLIAAKRALRVLQAQGYTSQPGNVLEMLEAVIAKATSGAA